VMLLVTLIFLSFIYATAGFITPLAKRQSVGGIPSHHSSHLHSTKAASEIWEDCAGCRLLRPQSDLPPKGVIHFLGGAFVSPEPSIAYRYVLESLSRRGYCIVATPFAVDFDYRKPAEDIRRSWKMARSSLEGGEYGDLPVVSMGHSLGALMHVLLACLYPEDFVEEVSGSALLSYNNKPVEGAIPLFKEVFVPALSPLNGVLQGTGFKDALDTGKQIRRDVFSSVRDTAQSVKNAFNLGPNDSFLPGVAPIFLKALDDVEAAAGLVDQIPGVLTSISLGASEFEPSPSEMQELVASSYSQRSPLVLNFSDDGIDESDVLSSILPSGLGVVRKTLPGTHVTPIAIDPDAASTPLLPIPEGLDDVLNIRSALLSDADALVDAVDNYFTSAIAATGNAPAAKQESAGSASSM